ncbi:MAG: heme exporter protein CcmD [Gammaproteobacteria bacterium]|nr:heme exporter protein CcmD [Gammaproteobacteria bacterium]
MAEFLAMGGYAFFVWSAYGLVAVVLVGNAAVPWWWHRRLKNERESSKESN